MPSGTAEGVDAEQRDLAAALRDLAVVIAIEAAELGTEMQAGGLTIDTKSSDTDLVTTADRAVEALIRERIGAARPDDAILGEEQGQHDDAPDAAVRWVIDPIDGTTNYVYRHPSWSVSIAAELDGRSIAGAVRDSTHDQTFAAAAGHGATCNGERLHLGDPAPLSRVLMATGFGYDPDRRRAQAEVMVGVLPHIRDIRRMGSAAVDLCSVALGRVDAYYELGLSPWDLAAGSVIASEAGARVADLDGGPVVAGGHVLAAHPDRWDEIADLLARSGA
jgi:myo-inositol-1(or 4)-monophosphatase